MPLTECHQPAQNSTHAPQSQKNRRKIRRINKKLQLSLNSRTPQPLRQNQSSKGDSFSYPTYILPHPLFSCQAFYTTLYKKTLFSIFRKIFDYPLLLFRFFAIIAFEQDRHPYRSPFRHSRLQTNSFPHTRHLHSYSHSPRLSLCRLRKTSTSPNLEPLSIIFAILLIHSPPSFHSTPFSFLCQPFGVKKLTVFV